MTKTILVPTMIQRMLDAPWPPAQDISSLRSVMYGGAPIYVDRLKQALARFGPIFVQAYAQGEAPLACTFLDKRDHAAGVEGRLASAGLKAAALHADRTQAQRTQAVEGFRSGRHRVLVATDVAARGLDIDGITHVVNYEVPPSREAYVHRVGRTGRADATGTALTLVAPEELRALQALQRSFGTELQG